MKEKCLIVFGSLIVIFIVVFLFIKTPLACSSITDPTPRQSEPNINVVNGSNAATSSSISGSTSFSNPVVNNYVQSGNNSGKYEEIREMAGVVSAAVTTALRFKEGAHSDRTDSRVVPVSTIVEYLSEVEYEECKRGKGSEGDVKILDGLVRPQFYKTVKISYHLDKSTIPASSRFIGFLTGIASKNDVSMENVVYSIGERAMENGATDLVLLKESATEWGDTTGYAFDLGAFVTSIIGGAGNRAIGPGGSASAGVNGMKGGSADRSDCKFAVFVSKDQLEAVAKMKK